MKQRALGRSGIKVSELCLGAMNFGNPRYGLSEADCIATIHAFLDRGGNFIDTADAYSGGASERIVGAALDGRRDRVIVATKGYFPVVGAFGEPPAHANAFGSSRRHLRLALEASLKRLGTDAVDLYQVHCWDPQTPIEETLGALDGFVRAGMTRYVGISNYSAWQIAESNLLCTLHRFEPFITAQMQYSLVCRSIEDDVIPVCRRHGIGLLPWSPLGGGILTGKYHDRGAGLAATADQARFGGPPPTEAAARWRARFLNPANDAIVGAVVGVADKVGATHTAVSLAWLLGREAVASVIIGPKTLAQLEENLAALALDLPPDATAALDRASAPPDRYPEWFIRQSPRAI